MARPELDKRFTTSWFDPLRPTDLLNDEVRQRRESGYDVVRRAEALDVTDRAAVLALVDELADAQRDPAWAYDEPDDLAGITASWPSRPESADPGDLSDRIHAAWLGRIAGCNMGKPVEWGWTWTREKIRAYLELAGAYPLRDYIPVLDPMPEGFELRDNWPETTKGNVDGSARDDDVDYPILALHLLEQHGNELRPEHVGAAWTRLFPLFQVFTAERAAYVNLTNGLTGDAVARFRNPYREWIGALIRGDVFGYVHAGDPWAAAAHSYQDARLSHTGNGIYGEMWAAALCAAAFTGPGVREVLDRAALVVPPRSRSVMGVLTGTAHLPPHIVEPLHDRTRSALFGFDHSRISELAARTTALAGTLATRSG